MDHFFRGSCHQNATAASLPGRRLALTVHLTGARSARIVFRRRAYQGGIADRKETIDREHDPSITRQAVVLQIGRGSVYYLLRPVPDADLAFMQRLDRLHLEFPFAGSRMLSGPLAAKECKIGRRHVKTLMRRMGTEALYRRPRTTKREAGHRIYPHLLRSMVIMRRDDGQHRSGSGLSPSQKLEDPLQRRKRPA
ncbi:hypothetical protein ACVJGD_008646 [Bradyrhizobium sp. USDA 10063]